MSNRVLFAVVYLAAFFAGLIGSVMFYIGTTTPTELDGQLYDMAVWGLVLAVIGGTIVTIGIAIDWYRGEPFGFQRHPPVEPPVKELHPKPARSSRGVFIDEDQDAGDPPVDDGETR